MDLKQLTLKKAIKHIKDKSLQPVELLDYYVKNILDDNKNSDKINAVIHLQQQSAAEQLSKVDFDKPLSGIPVVIKDNMNQQGFPVTCGSNILKSYISSYTGTAVQNLLDNGAVVLGRSNMDEFAMGSSTETSCYGVTRNPADRDRIPGGSSGGSAAAVAADQVLCALGSDTGGSIRQPAALCGVVGLKPTYGLVSRYGLVAYGSSLDQIGPITRTVEDAAILLNVIASQDQRDSTSLKSKVSDYTVNLERSIKGLNIGLPKEFFSDALDPQIRSKIDNVIDFYKKQGCNIKEISLPFTEYAIEDYYILATAEASANLARFDGIRYGSRSTESKSLQDVYFNSRNQGFGTEVKRRILLGTYVLSSGYYDAYYLKAQKVRRLIKNNFTDSFKEVDIIIGPVTPTPAFKIGNKIDDPVQMYLNDIYTTSLNLTGLPGISIPCGTTKEGLPVGFQIIGNSFQDELILNSGHIYDKEYSKY